MKDLLRYRDLIRTLVIRDLKVRYRRSALGLLWTILQPLLMMAVLGMVFSAVFRFEIENYPVYALAGILFWNFFSQSITASMNSLRANAYLIGKLPIPKLVFPLAAVLAGVVNFAFALVPLLGLLILSEHPIRWSLLFLPVAVVIATVFTFGAGLLLSPLSVFFTDIVELVGVLLTLLMYMTPVFYPMAIVPDQYRWLVRFNPVRSILEVFRDPIYWGKIPPITHLAVAVTVSLIAFGIGLLVFRRTANRIPFYI